MKTIKNKSSKIILCGVQGCCPTVEFKEREVIIKDDFGGRVKLNKDQWNDLVKRFKKSK